MRIKELLCLFFMLFWVGICCAQDLTIHVNKKGKVGFVDKKGKEVIKCEYESVTPFVNDVSIVTKSGKKGIKYIWKSCFTH